jgi:hypothetical protein
MPSTRFGSSPLWTNRLEGWACRADALVPRPPGARRLSFACLAGHHLPFYFDDTHSRRPKDTRRLPALQLGRRCLGVDSTANYTAVASETHNDHGPDENALSVPGLTAASLPGTTGEPGAQNPAAPRRSDLASPGFDSSDVSAQTF